LSASCSNEWDVPKKIYLSKSAWIPGGGLSAADVKCLADAPVGPDGLPSRLLALAGHPVARQAYRGKSLRFPGQYRLFAAYSPRTLRLDLTNAYSYA
jgi:hypothetical protein